MNRPRKQRREIAPQPPPEDPLRGFARWGFVAVLALRSLTTTEGTADGSTILLAQCALLIGLPWTWSLLRDPEARLRCSRLDVAILALAAVQVVAAVGVAVRGGDLRAAANVASEWVAVAVAYFVARQVFDSRRRVGQLAAAVVGLSVGIAALGLWQTSIEWPRLRAQYLEEREELEDLQAKPPAARTVAESARLRELLSNWNTQGIPVAGPGRLAFEQRLLHSSEPLGRFALANTLAGWLLPGIFLLAGFLLEGWRRGGGRPLVVVAVCLLMVSTCLLLTKSRTAYAGVLAGGAVWWFLERARRRPAARSDVAPDSTTADQVDATTAAAEDAHPNGSEGSVPRGRWSGWTWALTAAAVLLVVVGGLAWRGGLDAAVVAQAPRSLAFRLQYWGATLDVIADRPWLGTGPGNFRQHYTRFKWPESSEEISDPHNFVLEVWATAGTPALLVLLAVVGLTAAALLTAGKPVGPQGTISPPESREDGESIDWGLVFGVLLLGLWQSLLGDPDWPLFAGVGVIAVTVAAFFRRISNEGRLSVVAVAGGLSALTVHLLGAGGIGMPAVQTVLSVLLVLAMFEPARGVRPTWRVSSCVGLVWGACFVLVLVTSTVPVLGSQLESMSARAAEVEGRFDRARALLQRAAERDPWSPAAPAAIAALEFGVWKNVNPANAVRLKQAVTQQDEAIERDPYSATRSLNRATMLAAGFRRMNDADLGRRAAAELERATFLYPTRAATFAQQALLLKDLGEMDEARTAARRALELDGVNRREGHTDRFLEDELRTRLLELAGEPPGASNG